MFLKEDGQDAQADATDGVLMVASESRSFSVRDMLDAVLKTWSISKTAKAVHSGMHPDDQQIILEWMLDHQDVTIARFAQVSTPMVLVYCQCLQNILRCHLQQLHTSLPSC